MAPTVDPHPLNRLIEISDDNLDALLSMLVRDFQKPDVCWGWRGKVADGFIAFYLRVADGGLVSCKAHRLVYELSFGPLPEGIKVRQTCRNRSCCNPQHLEADLPFYWSFPRLLPMPGRTFNRLLSFITHPSSDPDACWGWRKSLLDGYARFLWDETRVCRAHRLTYQLAYGPVPDEINIHHKCENPICTNPLHLEALPLDEHAKYHHPRKEFCARGHTMSDAYIRKDGTRTCKTCYNEGRKRVYRQTHPPRTPKMVCKRGHPLEGANLQLAKKRNPDGSERMARTCRTCSIAKCQRYCDAHREQLNAKARARLDVKRGGPPQPRKKKTHCINGHELTEENCYLYTDKQGWPMRVCKTCRKAREVLRQLAKTKRLAQQVS